MLFQKQISEHIKEITDDPQSQVMFSNLPIPTQTFDQDLHFAKLKDLTLKQVGLTNFRRLLSLIVSPYLSTVDLSFNPLAQGAIQNLCKVLPLSAIRRLNLSYIRMSTESLRKLQLVTN